MQKFGSASVGGLVKIRFNIAFAKSKFMGWLLVTTIVPCRGVAKLVKALDFDSSIRRFDSFHPCQIFETENSVFTKEKAVETAFSAIKVAGLCILEAGIGTHCQVCVATKS